jgi:GNAT superfamily N-acetyltransferase
VSDLTKEIIRVDDADAVVELCQRAMGPGCPDPDDLRASLFGRSSTQGANGTDGSDGIDGTEDTEGVMVRGDPAVGVVATVRRGGTGHIRLIAVEPGHQRQGVGQGLVTAAEADLEGCSKIMVGADAPDYLFPGVATSLTPMLCLLESRGYRNTGANLNMDVDLAGLDERPPPRVALLATGEDRSEVEDWMKRHWPNWADEALRGLDKQRLLISRDAEGISGFCAWDVNRGGWLGPIGVRPDLYGKRTGVPLLMEALHRMRDDGRTRAEIAWISPIRFYVRNAGARIGTVYLVFEKERRADRARAD